MVPAASASWQQNTLTGSVVTAMASIRSRAALVLKPFGHEPEILF
jgi:hypothetical protein